MAHRKSEQQTPLIDSDWLLGPMEQPSHWRRMRTLFLQGSLLLLLVGVGLWGWPRLSQLWLLHHLTAQFREGATQEIRHDGLICLAKLLPTSLPIVIGGLTKSDAAEARSAFQAIDDYLNRVADLPHEERRARYAELVYELAKQLPALPEQHLTLVRSLTLRVRAAQALDNHPGAQVTLASCDQILEHGRDQPALDTAKGQGTVVSAASPSMATPAIGLQTARSPRGGPVTSSRLSDLADDSTSGSLPAVVVADRAPLTTLDVPSPEGDQTALASLPPITPAIPANQTIDVESLSQPPLVAAAAGESLTSAAAGLTAERHPTAAPAEASAQTSWNPEDASDSLRLDSPSSGKLRQKLLRANRFIPVSGSISIPIQSTATSTAASLPGPAEEVLGMRRQKTIDLLRLLTSIQPRVATAAFHELQRDRLTREELSLAVSLAQGDTEERLQALESLVSHPRLDPILWLSWMANDADREVRFKAVSMLGSLNSEEARRQLRLMGNRESDREISRHIQQALLANSSSTVQH
jgi:hypothetical protein